MYFHMQGGIGNQLFQLSYILGYKGDEPLNICLHRGQIHPSVLDLGLDENKALEQYRIAFTSQCPWKEKLFDFSLVALANRVKTKSHRRIIKNIFNTNLGDDEFTSLRRRSWGYFQSQPLGHASVEKVRSLFKFTEPSDSLEVVVHFRGQDFFGNNFGVLGREYFRRAAEILATRISEVTAARVICLARDVELASKVLDGLFGSLTFRDQPVTEDYSDLMNAKYLILSNSTLAFWAASMNQHCSLVLAPNPTYSNHPNLAYPENWTLCESFFL